MQLPALFGKYELEKFLGGGMSQVYKATDTVLHRTVAVKLLTDDGCRDEDIKKRFLLEARMSGNIIHDNIIRIHDYGEIDGRPYIVMEFLIGQDLRTAIERGLTGDIKQKLNIAVQAARALAFVHTKNIVHRDIKPENLHIDEGGRVRLMDFGIAKSANLNITREGFAIGTPYYMAPEQVLGKPVTPAADVYAFAIVMYEMLTGLKPVMGDTVESLFYQILHQPLDPEPMQKAMVPQDLINLVSRCASKKPEERPSSFEVVTSELEAILRKLEGPAVPAKTALSDNWQTDQKPASQTPPPTAAKKSLMPFVAIGGALVIAAAVLAVVFVPKDPKPDPSKKTNGKIVVAEKKGPAERIQNEFGEMILIPEGSFLFGSTNEVRRLPAFYVDKTEVPVGQWNRFAQATGKSVRDEPADLPVTMVTLDEAVEFAAWAQKSVPTAEQWEKAARGKDGRAYPWGNEPDIHKVNVKGNTSIPPNKLQPVESMLEGATPLGLLNMAGNAWEWVRDPRKPHPETVKNFAFMKATMAEGWTSVRGGGYDYDIKAAIAYEFSTMPVRVKHKAIGFRCVREIGQ